VPLSAPPVLLSPPVPWDEPPLSPSSLPQPSEMEPANAKMNATERALVTIVML
jgi:hypothetical protein